MYQLKEYPIYSGDREYDLITIAAGVVLIQDRKVLVVRESDESVYSFPGGTLEGNESPEQTAIREVEEELRVRVSIETNPFITQFTRKVGNQYELLLLYHYHVSSIYGTLQLASDAREMQWKAVTDNFLDCFPNVEVAARHFINQYGQNPGYTINKSQ
jgi:ADP-ribose pyrophosphatase YjhB (NUDIX family)